MVMLAADEWEHTVPTGEGVKHEGASHCCHVFPLVGTQMLEGPS